MRDAATSKLPEHIQRLQAPLQVWDYVFHLQRRVAELEAQLRTRDLSPMGGGPSHMAGRAR